MDDLPSHSIYTETTLPAFLEERRACHSADAPIGVILKAKYDENEALSINTLPFAELVRQAANTCKLYYLETADADLGAALSELSLPSKVNHLFLFCHGSGPVERPGLRFGPSAEGLLASTDVSKLDLTVHIAEDAHIYLIACLAGQFMTSAFQTELPGASVYGSNYKISSPGYFFIPERSPPLIFAQDTPEGVIVSSVHPFHSPEKDLIRDCSSEIAELPAGRFWKSIQTPAPFDDMTRTYLLEQAARGDLFAQKAVLDSLDLTLDELLVYARRGNLQAQMLFVKRIAENPTLPFDPTELARYFIATASNKSPYSPPTVLKILRLIDLPLYIDELTLLAPREDWAKIALYYHSYVTYTGSQLFEIATTESDHLSFYTASWILSESKTENLEIYRELYLHFNKTLSILPEKLLDLARAGYPYAKIAYLEHIARHPKTPFNPEELAEFYISYALENHPCPLDIALIILSKIDLKPHVRKLKAVDSEAYPLVRIAIYYYILPISNPLKVQEFIDLAIRKKNLLGLFVAGSLAATRKEYSEAAKLFGHSYALRESKSRLETLLHYTPEASRQLFLNESEESL